MGVSAAMIIRDSERSIERCLNSIIAAVDEIVIVDTGSTDRTIEIVSSYCEAHEQVKLYHFEWINDFSAARNFSLSKVSHDWVFVVDSDDYLPADDRGKIKSYTSQMDQEGRKCVFDIVYDNSVDGKIVESIAYGYVRLFPSSLRYEDMIHEQIVYAPLERIRSDIHLEHDGYDMNQVDIKAKKKRNIELLILNLQQDQNNARLWMHLGREMSGLDNEKALRYLNLAESKTTNAELLGWIEMSKQDLIER
ncbi:glycosyltransferase family 2 protein [Paenibacillus sp. FSL R5-0407]|uniref:glycosyltransferase family 2 protein n=1 Tax=Paenibacillus sp. FSL R5-0407 TaxID=2975320 RepID=UPI0030F710B1